MDITPEGLKRLDEAIAWAEKHPEQHDQNSWFFKSPERTTMCLGGIVVHLVGAEPQWTQDACTASTVTYQGYTFGIESLAADLLQIDVSTANYLFYAADSLDDLKRMRNHLVEGRPLAL